MAFCHLGMKVQHATAGAGMPLGDSTHTVTHSQSQSCAVTVTVRVPVYYMCYLAILTLSLLTWKIW
jgi:hypothetical protein